ncbi:hypothetical protein Tco_1084969 [Tanacetum coccineum]
MCTRSSSNLIVESSTTLKRHNRRRSKQRVKPFSLEETPVVTMADQLEDTTSVIDHYLGGMVLRKPFVKESGLIYDKYEGMITFEKDKERITFKMPHKMERFKHIDKEILKIDNIPSFIITSDDSDQEKTYYSDNLNLRPAYRQDKSVTKAIQCLIKMKSRKGKGEVT